MINFLKKYKYIILLTLLGAFYRFYMLGYHPLWIDESLFYYYKVNGSHQEFVTLFISRLFPTTEFWLRFPSALFGTLSIPAMYFVIKDKKLAFYAAFIMAFFPLFVFWSRMARPYAVAGFFVILGWRYWYFSIVSIMVTPYSILGIDMTRSKFHKFYIFLIPLAFFMFLIRPDSEKSFFNLEFLLDAKRLWYVPLVACILYTFDIIVPCWKQRHDLIKKVRMVQWNRVLFRLVRKKV